MILKRLKNHAGYVLYREQTLLKRAFWDLLCSANLKEMLAESCLYSAHLPPLLADDAMAEHMGLYTGVEFTQPRHEYVYRLRQSSLLEPDFGYLIVKPFSIVDLAFAGSGYVRSRRHMAAFSGLPNFSKLIRRSMRFPVRREAQVITMRFPFEANYYHCFQENLSRLKMVDEVVGDTAIPIVVGRKLAETPFFQAMSRRGSLAKRNWIVQDGFYVDAEEVIFAQTSQGNRERLDHLLDAIDAPRADPAASRRVFLTRPSSGNLNGRYIRNMDEVVALVERHGFDVVDTAAMSLEEQMTLFSQTSHVVSVHGAGLTNILFRRGGRLSVTEIFPPNDAPLHYYVLAKAYGYDYQHVTGHNPSDRSRRASFELDVDALEQKLNLCLRTPTTH